MLSSTRAVGAGLGFVALCGVLVTAMPLAPGDENLYLPPPPAVVQEELLRQPLGLIDAVRIAERTTDGRAFSAAFNANQTEGASWDVVVYGGGEARRLRIDSSSGDVRSNESVPRFPGAAVDGEFQQTESGLQYIDVVVGTGAKPVDDSSVVKVHFTRWLMDGTRVDSSRDRGEAITMPLGRFAGISEGLQDMCVGGTRKVIVPSDPDGAGPPSPTTTMVLDVELLDVVDYTAVPDVLPGDPVSGEPVVTDSGLTYYDIVVGAGEQPRGPNAVVRVHYTGWLNDGTKFDSSVDRGEPTSFPISKVIAGWTEGVGSMRVGGKRKLIIPARLAYGDGGTGPIPPGATLIFDVELLHVAVPTANPKRIEP